MQQMSRISGNFVEEFVVSLATDIDLRTIHVFCGNYSSFHLSVIGHPVLSATETPTRMYCS